MKTSCFITVILLLFFFGMVRAEDASSNASGEAVEQPFTFTVNASPSSGQAPLDVLFTAVSDRQEPVTFAWDFNGDGMTDSTEQNPSTTFEQPGDYIIVITATDAQNSTVQKSILVSVMENPAAGLNITSYFPAAIQEGENEITIILRNNGEQALSDLSGKLVGPGIRHLSSTSISVLKAGDEDSLNLKAQFLRSGTLSATLKIAGVNFPVTFEVAPAVTYSKEELQQRLAQLKEAVQAQESTYYDKKAQGYLVTEVFESIKDVKRRLQDAQQSLLTGNLNGAAVGLDIVFSAVEDITADLDHAQKQKQTMMMWLKDNALAITAIIAALGTLSGILVKVTSHTKKLGENVWQKVNFKKNETTKKDETAAVVNEVLMASEGSEKTKTAEEKNEEKKDENGPASV
ncbi:MAG TPA: PKD domain-containing protein [Candidatus Nanoarchaeia archaeon]|nr:PKD domain-containing protein [Candidatus Nanoarchaeia archaeon]